MNKQVQERKEKKGRRQGERERTEKNNRNFIFIFNKLRSQRKTRNQLITLIFQKKEHKEKKGKKHLKLGYR